MKQILILLLLFGLAFAWSPAPPTGIPVTSSLFGLNFAIYPNGTSLPNGFDFQSWRWLSVPNLTTSAGTLTPLSISAGKWTGGLAAAPADAFVDWAFFQPSNNITMNMSFTCTNAGGTITTTLIGTNGTVVFSSAACAGTTQYMNLTGYVNGTNYIINSSTNSVYVSSGGVFRISNILHPPSPNPASIAFSFTDFNVTSAANAYLYSSQAVYMDTPDSDYRSTYLGYGLLSDFRNFSNYSAGSTANTFNNVLLSPTSQIILPEITYFPANDSFPIFYNVTTGASFMKNNTAAYVYDAETLAWYFVPPLVTTDNSLVYTESVYYVASGSSANPSMPTVPMYSKCQNINNTFVINATFFTTVNHTVNYGNSTAMLAYQLTSPSIYYVVPLSNYTYANYTVNGADMCQHSNSTQIIPMPTVGFPATVGKLLMAILFIGALAIGVLNPFALLFAAAFNDVYGFLNIAQMSLAVVGCAFGSIMVSKQSASLKALFVYVLVGISIIVAFNGGGVIFTGINLAPLTNFYQSVEAFSTNSTTTNIFSFTVATASFLINLGLLILQVPLIASDFVIAVIMALSPPIANVAAPIIKALALAMSLAFIMFLYEIIRNLFPRESTGGGLFG